MIDADTIKIILDFLGQFPYVNLVLSVLGLVWGGLIAMKGTLLAAVKLTPSLKDDVFVQKLYAFLDKYGIAGKGLKAHNDGAQVKAAKKVL